MASAQVSAFVIPSYDITLKSFGARLKRRGIAAHAPPTTASSWILLHKATD
jgi:hypothetical protein